ncbi:hypothetical protein HHI36_017369 [Cryptolaemus montrouzieri]|uniref:Uncharacterized protein n=1 Tax=Cryptolaemus montrouzieri TaxID=559131 RepID=A0ABD2NMQ7_9CUCU
MKRQLSKLKTNDCRVKRGANCGSDQRLVAAKLVVPYQTSRSKTGTGLVPEEQGTSISEDERKRYRFDLLQQKASNICTKEDSIRLLQRPHPQKISKRNKVISSWL